MAMVVMETPAASDSALEDASVTANTLLEAGGCTSVSDGATLSLSSAACYELNFNDDSFQTSFTIDLSSTSSTAFAIFAEHDPVEFEKTSHYLLAIDGTDVEAEHELPEDDHDEAKPWGSVLVWCFVVNLATFSGVALIGLSFFSSETSANAQGALQGFAGGALIACAVFLMFIEANHIMASEWPDEVESTWRWGAAVLGGFATPMALMVCFDLLHPKNEDGANEEKGVEMTATIGGSEGAEITEDVKKNASMKTVIAVSIGDFAHNITDGFAIGVAFKLCSHSVAMGIVAATLYHEIAQEISDFVILTSPEVNLSTAKALAVNFIAGTSVIAGGLLATGLDLDNGAVGVVLAYGGGTYLYLGAVECIPRALAQSDNIKAHGYAQFKRHYATVLAAFVIGAVSIGLILLDHKHCEAEGGAHDH